MGDRSAATSANDRGVALIRRGRRDEARACFESAIRMDAGCASAYSNLGALLADPHAALTLHRRAVALAPGYALGHHNLGNALRQTGDPEAALAAYRQALALRPDLAEAQNAIGTILLDRGADAEAQAAFAAVVAMRPRSAVAHSNLAAALRRTGMLTAALHALDTAVLLDPGYARARSNRGLLKRDMRLYDEALVDLAAAAALAPADVGIALHLSGLLRRLRRVPEAVAACRDAVRRNPAGAALRAGLANLLHETGDLEGAEAVCREALALDPAMAQAHNTLGNVRRSQGRIADAVAAYRHALDLAPDAAPIRSGLLFTLQFASGVRPADLLAEARDWAARHEAPLAVERRPHGNDRTPDRRLRVGYVCAYFHLHAAASFLLPVLARHDPARVEVFCYSGDMAPDDVTRRFRAQGHVWRETAGLSDAELAAQVRADGIDVLVDLALHMDGSRLLAFARKPAPVQVTWLGYPGTTGLAAMDYRLTDAVLDPPGVTDLHYAERSIRLPHTFWCYAPLVETPEVSPLPARAAGQITFGCLNNFIKVTPETVDLWARVLAVVSGSRMVILSDAGSHRDAIGTRFGHAGVDPDRVAFVSRLPPVEYFGLYRRIDLCLDTVPYPGHTTTLDGLWMGVPVISLAGETAVSRGGMSILSNVGLRHLATESAEAYVATAAAVVADLPSLAELRRNLRERLRASPLMDAALFAGQLEDAYRRMWTEWCCTAAS